LSSWARVEVKLARAAVAWGRKTAARWQFWNASRTPWWRSTAVRIASLAIRRSSWALDASSGGGTWLSAKSAPAQLGYEARDEGPRVGQRGAHAVEEFLVRYLALAGGAEQFW